MALQTAENAEATTITVEATATWFIDRWVIAIDNNTGPPLFVKLLADVDDTVNRVLTRRQGGAGPVVKVHVYEYR